ncbi:methyltransferase domain-containing protein [Streptomyces sp. ISL-100]|uniref:methyltransferase domain-containing protein n=1 Tax=Streptomyces sp. ISL-100 TaxID=2819173 RepID=UPI0035AB6BE9
MYGTGAGHGCGAGRLVEELARRGRTVLGIDVCPSAVIATVCRGGKALCSSVFEPLPDEGRWGTALLIDGNIGIGGDPGRLLRRIRDLVHSRGLVIVETAPGDDDERRHVRIHAGRRPVSAGFPWASVGAPALDGTPGHRAGRRSSGGPTARAVTSWRCVLSADVVPRVSGALTRATCVR